MAHAGATSPSYGAVWTAFASGTAESTGAHDTPTISRPQGDHRQPYCRPIAVGVLAGPNGAANSAGVAAQRYGFASGSSRTLTFFRILREVQR
jgi:hypothetical protein